MAYRETITKTAEAEGKYIRQTGGTGQYGHIWLRVTPNEPGKGFEFENKIVGGAIPKEFIAAVEKGVAGGHAGGVLAGYPMVDVKVELFDGSFHDVDSSEMAFKIAGSMAFKDGLHKASPVLLEPIMNVEVVTPEDFMGDVIGDLNARRGKIHGMKPAARRAGHRAEVPLAEMFGYCHRPAHHRPGPGDVHHAVHPLRAGAEAGRRRQPCAGESPTGRYFSRATQTVLERAGARGAT